MGKKYIMALDQGTTSSRCILFDHEGNICGMAQKELTQIYPQPGWVEQNPREIWSTQLSVLTEALAVTGAMPEDIEGIGITNQRETTIVWNRFTGVPVYNAIVWQCRRTAEQIDRLKEEKFDELIRERTGLIADAYFSASKIGQCRRCTGTGRGRKPFIWNRGHLADLESDRRRCACDRLFQRIQNNAL